MAPSLLTLPAEVRLNIYRQLLASPRRILASDTFDHFQYTAHISVLALNQQIRNEAKGVLYKENVYYHEVRYLGFYHFDNHTQSLRALRVWSPHLRAVSLCLYLHHYLSTWCCYTPETFNNLATSLARSCDVLVSMPALKEIKLLVYAENTVWEDANLNCSPDLQKLVSEKYGAILEGLEGLPMVIELGLGEVEMGERAAVTHVQTFKDCFDQMLVNREWKARLAAAEGLVALSFGTRFHGPHGCLELDSGME